MSSACHNNRQWMNDSHEGSGDEGVALGSLSPSTVDRLQRTICSETKKEQMTICWLRRNWTRKMLLMKFYFCVQVWKITLSRFITRCTKAAASVISCLTSRSRYIVKEKNGRNKKYFSSMQPAVSKSKNINPSWESIRPSAIIWSDRLKPV